MKGSIYAFYFQVKFTDRETHKVDVNQIEPPMIGHHPQANSEAQKRQEALQAQYPNKDVKVRAISQGEVPLIAAQQIHMLAHEMNSMGVVLGILAADIAKDKASKSLELNPDLDAITNVIVKEAFARAREFQQQAAKQAKSVVIAEGQA